MVVSLLFGALIGAIVALPPGPVGITAIKIGLFQDRKSGWQLAAGNGVMDFIFCMMAIFTATAFNELIEAIAADYPILTIIVQFIVVMGFILIGLFNLKSDTIKLDYNEQKISGPKILQSLIRRGPLFLGIALALTNIANPTFMPSLAWISYKVQNWGWIETTTLSSFMFAIGFGLGNTLWIGALSGIVARFKHKMSDQFILRIRQFAGLTFLGFGTVIGIRVFSIAKWPELIRLVFAF